MENIRTRRPRILINKPFIDSSKKHVGTRVQFSKSTDFNNTEAMVFDKTIFLQGANITYPQGDNKYLQLNDILNIKITEQESDKPLEISLDSLYYYRYQLLFDSVSQPTQNYQTLVKNDWSVIGSIYGDQEGFRFDNIILTTPELTVKEEPGTVASSYLTVSAPNFAVIVGSGKHKYTSWVVFDTDNNQVFSRIKDEDNLTEIKLPLSLFKEGKLYNIAAKFHTDTNGESNYGNVVYLTNVVEPERFKITPILPFQHTKPLYFQLQLLSPNIRTVTVEVYQDENNNELKVLSKEFTLSQTAYTLELDSSTLKPGASYKVYAYCKINNNGTLYTTGRTFVHYFTLHRAEIYYTSPATQYPGKYSLIKPDLNLGGCVLNTKELQNGSILMVNNAKTAFKVYGRYGNALRGTDIEFDFPMLQSTSPDAVPYINVLPRYDGKVYVNYCQFNNSNYQDSIWAIYKPNLVTNEWTLLDAIQVSGEKLSTACSSSAIVARDNSVYYVPALYQDGTLDETQTGTQEVVADYNAWKWLKPNGDIQTTDVGINKNQEFVVSGTWTKSSKKSYVKSGTNGIATIDVPKKIKDTFTYGFQVEATINPILDGNNATGNTILAIGNNKDGSQSLIDIRTVLKGSGNEFQVDIYNRGTNKTASHVTLPNCTWNGSPITIKVTVRKDGVKLHVNNTKAAVWEDTIANLGDNITLHQDGKLLITFSGVKNENNSSILRKSSFEWGERVVLRKIQNDKKLKDIELPLCKITFDGSNLSRKILKQKVIPGITRNVTIAPLTLNLTTEEYVMIGGTNSTESKTEQVGVNKFALRNRNFFKFNPGDNERACNVTKITKKSNTSEFLELPQNKITNDRYDLCAQYRGDGKIILFNNTKTGPEASKNNTFLLDFHAPDVDFITQEGASPEAPNQTNDTRLDKPFRSTISMYNCDFIRMVYDENGATNLLLYPHTRLANYVDVQEGESVLINKNLVVNPGEVVAIENAYLYDTITILGDSPSNTGVLKWTDRDQLRVLDYRDRIITRNTTVTSEEDRATPKEHLWVLEGVNYTVKDKG